MNRLISGFLLFLMLIMPVGSAGAATIEEQIQALLQQIQALQAQVTDLSNTQRPTTSRQRDFTIGIDRSINQNLSLGMRGAEVTTLQEILTSHGFYNGPLTGYFGTLTQDAVKKFQASRGISTTGFVGEQTRSSLSSENTSETGTQSSGPIVRLSATAPSTCNGYTCIPYSGMITQGQSVTLKWTIQNATNCRANTSEPASDWGGGISVGSNSKTIIPAKSASYSIECTDAAGQSGKGEVYVSVVPTSIQPSTSVPSVDLKANGSNGPISISTFDTPVTLSWSSSHTKPYYCWTGQGYADWSGTLPANGTRTVKPSVSISNFGSSSGIIYEINCTDNLTNLGNNDAVTIKNTAAVTNILPTITSFSANKTSVAAGEAVSLTLTATNANFCNLDNGSQIIGWQSNSPFSNGSNYYATVYPTQTTVYNATCYNSPLGGTNGEGMVKSITVTVTPPIAAPTVSLNASPSTIAPGQSSTLYYSFSNPTGTCSFSASNANPYNGPSSGTAIVTPAITTTYILRCINSQGQSASASATVTVTQSTGGGTATGGTISPPTVNLSAFPDSIAPGQSSTLTVNASNATYCTDPRGVSGNHYMWPMQTYVYPTQTTTYSVTCYNSAGYAAAVSVTVYVSGVKGGVPIMLNTSQPLANTYSALYELLKQLSNTLGN